MNRRQHSIQDLLAITRQVGMLDRYDVAANYTSHGDCWCIVIFDAETCEIEYKAHIVDKPQGFMQNEKTIEQAYDDLRGYLL